MGIPRFAYILWLRISWFLRSTFGMKTYGLGWTASKVGKPFDFEFKGAPFRFLPQAARSYCLLPAGITNEPETHVFLDRALSYLSPVTFIDVGASIGEFVIPAAHDVRISTVLAFEPHPQTSEALRICAKGIPSEKLTIIQKAVGSAAGTASFDTNARAPSNAGIRSSAGCEASKVEVCTLDEACRIDAGTPLIMLMDIEGGELEALKGGQRLVKANNPLIVFEYNSTSRRHFNLAEVIGLLGDCYRFYRLRSADGCLDDDLNDTWNVVALPIQGPWKNFSSFPGLIVGGK